MSFAKLFSEIMRDYVTAGVPSSGVQKPSKSDLRTWGAAVEAACTANPNIGLTFLWDTGVNDADPGTGKIRGNNSIVSLITQIFVSETGSAGDALAGFLQAMDDAASNTKGILVLRDLSNLANMAAFTVTGSITDGGTYDKITVANLTSSGTFASGATIGLAFFRIGDTTHSGLDYAFDTGTSDANPGSGLLRFNNATLGSATVMYINKTGRNGESLGTLIGTWDDASATHRGHGRVFDINDRTKYIEFDLNGSLTDATTYWKVPLSNVAGGTTPASGAILDVVFARADWTLPGAEHRMEKELAKAHLPVIGGLELPKHFKAIAQNTSLPIMLYSIPGRCGIEIGLDVLAREARALIVLARRIADHGRELADEQDGGGQQQGRAVGALQPAEGGGQRGEDEQRHEGGRLPNVDDDDGPQRGLGIRGPGDGA